MTARLIKWIIPLLSAGFWGCVYSNNEIYEVQPVPGTPPTIIASANLDTVNANPYTDSLLISYEVSVEGGELYFVQSKIGQYSFYEYLPDYDPDTLQGPYVQADTFWMNVEVPPDSGIYTLHLDFYYSANTHSLGDIVGLEANVLYMEFLIDFKGPGP